MKTLLLLTLACVGCGPQIPGDGHLVIFDIDNAFSRTPTITDTIGTPHSELEALRMGIHLWNPLGANFKLADEVSPTDNSAPFAVHFGVHRDSATIAASGVCWPGLGYLTIYADHIESDVGNAYNFLVTTTAHEVGHALGLQHVGEEAVMNPADFDNQLTGSDTAQFHALWPKHI